MRGYLIRIGIDSKYGRWNAPVDPDSGSFVYVPIPERHQFIDGLETRYSDFIPDLEEFANDHSLDLHYDLRFPSELANANAHLDPDFRYLTYGDTGLARGSDIASLDEGDFIAFYSGLRPIKKTRDNLVYALTGFYLIDKVLWTAEIPDDRLHENAHTRKLDISDTDFIVKGKAVVSGRLSKCIPIGEYRNGAYRVKRKLIREWGGLSVKDGFIQRSIVPPSLLNPGKFYTWFNEQDPFLIEANNA